MIPAGDDQAPTALTLLCGGGFLFETTRLLEQIGPRERFAFLATEFGGIAGEDGIPDGAMLPIPSFSTMTDASLLKSAKAFAAAFAITMGVLRQRSITSVVVVGASYALPMLMAARLKRRRAIYIETITRVDQLSTTGRAVYFFRLATTYIVQWPYLQQRYPRTTLGTVL